jgi:uncharacterized RDD family membrane protein YckC
LPLRIATRRRTRAGRRASPRGRRRASFRPSPRPGPGTAPRPRGWWRRVGATLLDGLFIGLPLTILAISFGLADSADATLLRAAGWVVGVVYAALLLAYHRGQTLGKQAAGVRVLTEDGAPIGLGRATGREVVKAIFGVTFVLYVIDVLWPLWQSENRALHDLIAGTRVVEADPYP